MARRLIKYTIRLHGVVLGQTQLYIYLYHLLQFMCLHPVEEYLPSMAFFCLDY